MHGPPLVAWLLVALSAAAAVSCVLRKEARSEALLGVGMAVMAVPLSVFEPPRWSTATLALVFAAVAVHALRPSGHRASHRMHHSLCAGAMVYMSAAMAGAGPAHAGHAAHATAGTPLLTGLLLAYFAGYVLRAGSRLAMPDGPHGPHLAVPVAPGGAIRLRHAPEVAAACRVAMALAMFAMLLAL
ncbi:DUF5134 domain-containing protein [Actinacidiphila paucisporea]|uniref:DUF5134 domain-containing protein n=1 Tax=Actinacidiphila paucisporea TaxID=310782 RepID=A0A1M7B0M9_9ACTN|nr:DUF5134 domain-containing protein [Actinacidiphila paucisporea]SHL48229.1 protein of unknown function [Actinacidiphila paucisporea]